MGAHVCVCVHLFVYVSQERDKEWIYSERSLASVMLFYIYVHISSGLHGHGGRWESSYFKVINNPRTYIHSTAKTILSVNLLYTVCIFIFIFLCRIKSPDDTVTQSPICHSDNLSYSWEPLLISWMFK